MITAKGFVAIFIWYNDMVIDFNVDCRLLIGDTISWCPLFDNTVSWCHLVGDAINCVL